MKKLLLPVLILLAACSHQPSYDAPEALVSDKAPSYLKDTRWELTEILGEPVVYATADSAKIYIELKSQDGRLVGYDGCNSFSGTFEEKEGQRLRLQPLASTKKFCFDMPTKENVMEMLVGIDNYAIDGDRLMLTKARMAPMLRFKAVTK